MVGLALGLMAIAGGSAVGEAAGDTKITNPALAMAMQVDPVVIEADHASVRRARSSQIDEGLFSYMTVEVVEAPQRTMEGFGFSSELNDSRTPDMEVQFSASTPFNLDVGVAHRQTSVQTSGQLTEGRGAEVRLGQNLSRLAPEFKNPDAGRTAWYFFAASDGRALTWTPNSDPSDPNRDLRVQDRAEIGDVQAGFSMQKKGMQASLALVQRTVKNRIGPFKESKDESFAGLTLTWKR
jgi:hypothetical protein